MPRNFARDAMSRAQLGAVEAVRACRAPISAISACQDGHGIGMAWFMTVGHTRAEQTGSTEKAAHPVPPQGGVSIDSCTPLAKGFDSLLLEVEGINYHVGPEKHGRKIQVIQSEVVRARPTRPPKKPPRPTLNAWNLGRSRNRIGFAWILTGRGFEGLASGP